MVKRSREYKFVAEVADGVENDVLTVAVTTHWDPVETAATRPLAWDRQRYSYTGYIQAEDKRGATDPFIESSGRTWLAWGYDLLIYPTRLFVQHDVVLAKWNFAGNGCCIK